MTANRSGSVLAKPRNAAFRDFANTEPDRFAVIDGSGSIEEVHQQVVAAISQRFEVTA